MTIVKYIKEQEAYLKKLTPGTPEYNRAKQEIRRANIELIKLSLDPRNDLRSA